MVISWLTMVLALLLPQEENEYYSYGTTEFFKLVEVHKKIDPANLDRELVEAAVFHASNEIRSKKKKGTLGFDLHLNQAARFQADYLKDKQILDHRNTSGNRYQTPYKRIETFGGTAFASVSENLARVSPMMLDDDNVYFIKNGKPVDKGGNPIAMMTYAELARHVLDGWMNSKGHRKNLMGDYNFLGCGVSDITYNKDGIPQLNFVQNFGYK